MSIILRGFFIAAANVFYVTCGFGHFQFRHMIKALLLIFEPVKAWERVVRAQRSVVFILMVFLLPLLGLTSLAEGYGLVQWGRRQQDTLHLKQFTTAEAAAFETGQLLLSLATLFLATKIIKSLGETFHGRHSFSQVFTTMAYGLSPLFAMRLFDAFPGISHWVTWTAGILLSVTVLYQGVPRVMQPDRVISVPIRPMRRRKCVPRRRKRSSWTRCQPKRTTRWGWPRRATHSGRAPR